MNLFYQPLITEGVLHLDADESRHCIKVLRKRSGEEIRITDGKGFFYEARITKTDDRQCTFQIDKKIKEPARNFTIHIAISPTKNADRIEWFVEKAVEIGIDSITLLTCERTERTFIKTERLEKLAVGAMKQSIKYTLPVINGVTSFSALVKTQTSSSRFIAFVDHLNPHHLKDSIQPASDYLLLIGPEGDFTPDELSLAMLHDFKKVSLGPHRLRTETAGLAACHILNLINS